MVFFRGGMIFFEWIKYFFFWVLKVKLCRGELGFIFFRFMGEIKGLFLEFLERVLVFRF